jgi:hypothetical protein
MTPDRKLVVKTCAAPVVKDPTRPLLSARSVIYTVQYGGNVLDAEHTLQQPCSTCVPCWCMHLSVFTCLSSQVVHRLINVAAVSDTSGCTAYISCISLTICHFAFMHLQAVATC